MLFRSKKIKKKDDQKMDREERDLSVLRNRKTAMNFQINSTKRKERMKNRETESSGRWAQHRLWYPGGKTGESIVPLGLRNNIIKRGEGLRREGRKFTTESFEKVLSRRKLREISKITSWYPRKSHYSTYLDSKGIKFCKP